MQAAVPVGQGAMAALLGVGLDVGRALAAEAAQGEVCQVANDNEPTQVVISGAKTAIDRAGELAKKHGVRRFMPLNVSAPFHCAMMQPAADAMAEALGRIAIKPPAVPVVANVLASAITDPDEIRKRLVEQVTGTVRWRECVAYMAGQGVTCISARRARARCSPVSPSASPRTLMPFRSARLPISMRRSPSLSDRKHPMFELKGKTALVTGATGGIGGAIATRAARAGRYGRHLRHGRSTSSRRWRQSSRSAFTSARAIWATRSRSAS